MTLMNEAERQRFLDTMRENAEFRDAVRRELLTTELSNLPRTVATLVDIVVQQSRDIAALTAEVMHTLTGRRLPAVTGGYVGARW